MDPSPPPSSPLAPANFDPAVNAYYAPIASALSLAGGILLAVWSWRASTVVQCDHHDAVVLKILMCLGLADAYFALGWLVLTYEACVAGNVMVFTGTAAQATWTMVGTSRCDMTLASECFESPVRPAEPQTDVVGPQRPRWLMRVRKG